MKPDATAEHMPQLDGLRALAFVAVAISHWVPEFLAGIVPWGTGVQLFFVLSGFLITGILLRSRPADLGIPLRNALGIFYVRRILRIFPLYYGVIGLSLLFALGPIYDTWPWHVAYLSNFHYARHGHADAVTDPFLHLWSLSVEEQFYLVWPFVVLVTNRRALPVILVGSIAGSMVFRVGIAHLAPELASIRYLTPSCVDALAVGGLLGFAKHYFGGDGTRRLSRIYAWVGIMGLAVSTVPLVRIMGRDDAHRIGHTFLVIFYGAVVGGAARGLGGLPGRLLNFKPALYLGKISYGLYVYHYFAPLVISRGARFAGWESALERPPLALLAYSAFTLVAAIVSWHLYELPINRLKRHFSYPAPTRPVDRPTPDRTAVCP